MQTAATASADTSLNQRLLRPPPRRPSLTSLTSRCCTGSSSCCPPRPPRRSRPLPSRRSSAGGASSRWCCWRPPLLSPPPSWPMSFRAAPSRLAPRRPRRRAGNSDACRGAEERRRSLGRQALASQLWVIQPGFNAVPAVTEYAARTAWPHLVLPPPALAVRLRLAHRCCLLVCLRLRLWGALSTLVLLDAVLLVLQTRGRQQ